jgi:hypothetical protein
MKSFKPEFQIDNTGKWYDNALRFATKTEAENNAFDKMSSWFSVREYRVSESDDPVNYKYASGPVNDRGFKTFKLIPIAQTIAEEVTE